MCTKLTFKSRCMTSFSCKYCIKNEHVTTNKHVDDDGDDGDDDNNEKL